MTEWIRVARWVPERKSLLGAVPAHWTFSWHTKVCATMMLDRMERHRQWVRKWPKYCRACGASGVQFWTENQSPYGSGEHWPMEMREPCDCIDPMGEGEPILCPRCGVEVEEYLGGQHMRFVEGAPCPACGWWHGKGKDDVCPPMYDECGCWLQEDYPPVSAMLKDPASINTIEVLSGGRINKVVTRDGWVYVLEGKEEEDGARDEK